MIKITSSIYEKDYRYCPTCKAKLKRKLIDNQRLWCCPKCSFVFWNNPKPVVSMILHDGNRALLIQRANKPFKAYWCLPGGFVNYEETPEQAIIRETKEEVGLEIDKIEGLVGVYRIDNDPRGVNIDIIYEARVSNRRVSLSWEHKDFRLFPVNKLPKKIAYKHREAIEDWRKRGIKTQS